MTHQTEQQAIQTVRYIKQLVLILFPFLLVLGKLCSFDAPPTYFSSKHNILNQYFVKLGWFWTTLAFWLPYATWPSKTIPGLTRPGFRGVIARYVAATVWWIFFSQWFFGPPIMDRVFLWTGGSCIVGDHAIASATSSKVCRVQGGQWLGGHDPSGHFFLLMQSSMLLVQENVPYLYYLISAENAIIPRSFKFTLGLLSLWIWMFFITSIYFHSFTEKLSGLAFGYIEIIFVYYLGEVYWWGTWFGIHELDTEAVPKSGSDTTQTAPINSRANEPIAATTESTRIAL